MRKSILTFVYQQVELHQAFTDVFEILKQLVKYLEKYLNSFKVNLFKMQLMP